MKKEGKKIFILAYISIILLILFSMIYRITEIILFKGTAGYSLSSNISGMLALIAFYTLLFFGLLKKYKWIFWYGLILSIFLLLSYFFKSPFVWPYAVNAILLIIVIICLFILKKRLGKK